VAEATIPCTAPRPLKRAIQRLLQNPLAMECSTGSTPMETVSSRQERRRGWYSSGSVAEPGMTAALEQARHAAGLDEVPVGAVVMQGGRIVARAHNETVHRSDPTAHAELLAVQRALQALGTDRLDDCTLYVTLEPCAQCAGAIVLTKVGQISLRCLRRQSGDVRLGRGSRQASRLNHQVEMVGGVEAEACRELLKAFFAEKRARSSLSFFVLSPIPCDASSNFVV